jgi:hypothetical protein
MDVILPLRSTRQIPQAGVIISKTIEHPENRFGGYCSAQPCGDALEPK